MIYCTSYCNHGHRVTDGKPVEHECHILPPEVLEAEREGNFERAAELLEAAKPLRIHRGVPQSRRTRPKRKMHWTRRDGKPFLWRPRKSE